MDQMWGFFCDFFDFYVIFGRCYKDYVMRIMVNYCVEVQFFVDVGCCFNQNLVYWLVISVCLIGYQMFVQLVFCKGVNFFFVFYYFYIVCFVVVVSVNLIFYYLWVGIDFRCGFFGFMWSSIGIIYWCW